MRFIFTFTVDLTLSHDCLKWQLLRSQTILTVLSVMTARNNDYLEFLQTSDAICAYIDFKNDRVVKTVRPERNLNATTTVSY